MGIANKYWYYALGLFLGLIPNALWLTIASRAKLPAQIMLYGVVWDSLRMCVYVLMPILFFGVKPTIYTTIGIVLIAFGLLIIRRS